MVARTTRPRPRTAATRPRRGKPFWKKSSFAKRIKRTPTATLAWLAALILGLLAVIVLVDIPAALADVRDWLLTRLGLGLVIIAGWGGAALIAYWRQAYRGRATFLRSTAGALALGLFVWALFGLNRADWSLWGTDFRSVTLGGGFGHGLAAGALGKLTVVSLGVLAMALLAPVTTLAIARNAPVCAAYVWEHRWFQRSLAAVGRCIVALFSAGPREDPDEIADEGAVIGAGASRSTLRERLEGSAEGLSIRPTIDPAAPSPPVVAAHIDLVPNVMVDEPEASAEPTQLGLDLTPPRSRWQYPALDLLATPIPAVHRKHDNAARAQLIVDTLASFGVDATVVEINEGPTVTQFGVEPGWEVRYRELPLKDEFGKSILGTDGRAKTERVEVSRTRVRVNRITALQNDLALGLAAPTLRIEAPVPGRAIVGIEVPNDSASVVTLRSVMETKEFAELNRKSKLSIALGRGVAGGPVIADLAKMPHLLIAGATGSGKSVCMNSIIAGIMMNASPDEVRFVMVDPKRVELTAYEKIPHLVFSEVIVDVDKVVGVLQAVVAEMEGRYKKFAAVAVRNLESYNKHPKILKKLPQWVVIIDELADLMMAAPFEVEKLICRLAQLARATGIHLVVATQRPSVDVVTGLIKANFPTRIAFAVTSMTDSRTILDMGGAEKLLGRGDMLYMPTDAAKPLRIQGVYVSDAEVEHLVSFWADDRFAELAPEKADDLLEEALVERNGGPDMDIEADDPLVAQARTLAAQHSRVSPSLFQRRLRVGYVKACRIMDVLEEEGVVGPQDGGESRRVRVPAGFDDGRMLE